MLKLIPIYYVTGIRKSGNVSGNAKISERYNFRDLH